MRSLVRDFAGRPDESTQAAIKAYLELHHPELKLLEPAAPTKPLAYDQASLHAGWEHGKTLACTAASAGEFRARSSRRFPMTRSALSNIAIESAKVEVKALEIIGAPGGSTFMQIGREDSK